MNPEIERLESEANNLESRLNEIRGRLYTLYYNEPPGEEELVRQREWAALTPGQAHQKMMDAIYSALYKPNPGIIKTLLGEDK